MGPATACLDGAFVRPDMPFVGAPNPQFVPFPSSLNSHQPFQWAEWDILNPYPIYSYFAVFPNQALFDSAVLAVDIREIGESGCPVSRSLGVDN